MRVVHGRFGSMFIAEGTVFTSRVLLIASNCTFTHFVCNAFTPPRPLKWHCGDLGDSCGSFAASLDI